MYLKNATNLFKTVTFRLTLWYTILFGALSLIVFFLVYVSFTWNLRKQEENELLAKAKEFSSLYSDHGALALQAEFQREARSRGIHRVFFRLVSDAGQVLATSDMKHWKQDQKLHWLNYMTHGKQPVFRTLTFRGRAHKVRVLFMPLSDGKLLILGSTLRESERMMERYRETFGSALVIMLGCGSLLGWILARKSMAGVQRVTQTAIQIKEGNLSRRVSPGKEGLEIYNLASAFNEMLDRLEVLVSELREVTDNIAHDLRTPITRIRGIAETTVTGESDIEDYRDMGGTIIEECDRLIGMINTMLEITKTQAGVAKIASERVDMGEIVREAVDLFKPLAEGKNILLQLNIPSHPISTFGDRTKLQRIVANLLDNAVKYTPPGGTVTLSLRRGKCLIELDIIDTGFGISESDVSHIFDRFYRGDKSRSTPGSGLGLSLALALVKAHGGNISVETTKGKGSKFTVTLPYKTSPNSLF